MLAHCRKVSSLSNSARYFGTEGRVPRRIWLPPLKRDLIALCLGKGKWRVILANPRLPEPDLFKKHQDLEQFARYTLKHVLQHATISSYALPGFCKPATDATT